MNAKHYNNVIDWTLKHDTAAQTEDSLATARVIFNNMGVALPNGDMQEVYDTIKTNQYMGWRSCTMEEAQEAANNGTAAIGISNDKIVILSAADEEEPVTQTASVMTLSENTSAYAVTGLEYYTYSAATTICYLAYQFDGVQEFYYAADGDKYLTPNFRVREFRSKDGANEIKIDMELVRKLQVIRDWAGAPINIESGYRTQAHNAAVGGATGSKHLEGMAADIVCSSKSPLEIARKAESLGMWGIKCDACDDDDHTHYTHIDTREEGDKWYYRCDSTVNGMVTTFYN